MTILLIALDVTLLIILLIALIPPIYPSGSPPDPLRLLRSATITLVCAPGIKEDDVEEILI